MIKPVPQRADFRHFTTLEARWGDLDGLRHINHAAYLVYMETARLEYYRHLGYEVKRWDLDESTILASMQVDYRRQCAYPAVFEIGQAISRVGRTSFDIATAIFLKGEADPVVVATFTLVAYNYRLQQTIPVPEIIRRELES